MFTGIIQEIGRVAHVQRLGGGLRLSVRAPSAARELKVSDSVSVNGACQTVIAISEDTFTVESVEETLHKTTFGELKVSARVNIELPVRLGDRLGGHIVQGHVDCVGTIGSVTRQTSSWLVAVAFPSQFRRYVIPVGSIAVDGISLTVASLAETEFVVSVIPHTLEKTTLDEAAAGQRVNLEFDLLGKYVENMVHFGSTENNGAPLTVEKLKGWGYA